MTKVTYVRIVITAQAAAGGLRTVPYVLMMNVPSALHLTTVPASPALTTQSRVIVTMKTVNVWTGTSTTPLHMYVSYSVMRDAQHAITPTI